MAKYKNLSHLTRSLVVGASVGTVALTQIGCEQVPQTGDGGGEASEAGFVVSQRERPLCDRVLQTKSASDMNLLMQSFPSSRCIVPIMNSLPSSTLASLSPQVLAGLSPSVIRSIPPRVKNQLPVRFQVESASSSNPEDRNRGRY